MKIYVYIAECSDNSYYTGVTNNLDKRLSEHNEGVDPKSYTYPRRPVKIVFSEEFSEPIDAISAEKQIKGWSRKKKKALIDRDYEELVKLSKSKETKVKNGDK